MKKILTTSKFKSIRPIFNAIPVQLINSIHFQNNFDKFLNLHNFILYYSNHELNKVAVKTTYFITALTAIQIQRIIVIKQDFEIEMGNWLRMLSFPGATDTECPSRSSHGINSCVIQLFLGNSG